MPEAAAEPRVIVVDQTGRVYPDAEADAMENRARSAQQAENLRKGVLTAQQVASEADYVQPVGVNPVPESIVPFRFGAEGGIRPETLNANFAHIGNLVAQLKSDNMLLVRALDSLTDRLDRMAYLAAFAQPAPHQHEAASGQPPQPISMQQQGNYGVSAVELARQSQQVSRFDEINPPTPTTLVPGAPAADVNPPSTAPNRDEPQRIDATGTPTTRKGKRARPIEER